MKKLIQCLPLILIISVQSYGQQWHEADQPGGGEILSMDVSPHDSEKIVVMVRKHVDVWIWYSDDAGNNWRKIGQSYIAGGVKIDPVNNRIYASGWGKVMVTTDEGISWDILYQTPYYIEGLDYNPHNPSEIFFITPQGIYRSSDYGEEWTMFAHTYSPSSRKFTWSPHDTNHVIIAEVSEMLKSSDKGVTWTEVLVPGVDFPILFDPLQDSVLYRGEPGFDSTTFYRSTDYGTTWSYFPGFYYYHPDISYKENGAAAFLSYGHKGIYKSLDYGITWHRISQPVYCNLIHFNGNTLCASFPSTGFAIYKGGDVWESRNKGLNGQNFYSMTITKSHTFLSTFYNTFRKSNSTPAGEWESIRPDSTLLDICFYNDSIGFARDYSYRIFRTSDAGTSWHLFHDFFSTGRIEHIGIAGQWLFAAITDYSPGDEGLYKTLIGQSNWGRIIDGNNTRVIIDDSSSVYGFDSNNPEWLQKSYLGESWTHFADVQPGFSYRAYSPVQTPPGFLLGGTTDFGGVDRGVLYFIDQSGNATPLLSGIGIFGTAAPAGRSEYFFITTRQSIIYKADSLDGQPYHFDEGLPPVPVDQGGKNLFYFNIPGFQDKIYTNRGGLWVLDLDLVTESDEHTEKFDFSLDQNYPNPFNPTTRVKYSLPAYSSVELTIYDILGTEIVRLVNEEQPAGVYKVQWNAAGYPSGVYLCRLKAGSLNTVMKMMLIK